MPILSQIFTRFLESVSEDSDEDDEPISIPTPILEQIEQEKAQRQNERLSIQQDKRLLAINSDSYCDCLLSRNERH